MQASAAEPAWTAAVELASPANADTDAPDAILDGVACAAPGSCAAVGAYTDATGVDRAMVASQAAGAWSASALDPPVDADASHPEPNLLAVACGSPGSCSAVGDYTAAAGGIRPMVASRVDGVWSHATALQLPANANAAPDAGLAGVACPAAGSCTAIGFYKSATGAYRPMAATQVGGAWSPAVEIGLPANAATTAPEANLLSVACGAEESCAAVGYYKDNTGAIRPMAARRASGTWSPAVQIVLPANASSTAPNGYLIPLACGGAGSCVAGGTYSDAGGAVHAIVASLGDGTWSTAVLPLPSDANAADAAASVDAIACAAASSCGAAGTYTDAGGVPRTMVASQVGAAWSPASRLELPADADPDTPGSGKSSVACDSAGACVLAASYVDASNRERPMIASLGGGTWSAASALALPGDADANPDALATSVACGGPGSCVAGGAYTGAAGSRRAMVASVDPEATTPPGETPPPDETPPSTDTPPSTATPSVPADATAPAAKPAPATLRPVVILKSSKLVAANGAVKVKLSCQTARCSGTVKLTRTAGGATAGLAKASYTLARGRTLTITVRLTQAGRKALEHSRTRALRAELVISLTGAGAKSHSVSVHRPARFVY
jgi:hypothetical protein